jgi:hypothetical protein
MEDSAAHERFDRSLRFCRSIRQAAAQTAVLSRPVGDPRPVRVGSMIPASHGARDVTRVALAGVD